MIHKNVKKIPTIKKTTIYENFNFPYGTETPFVLCIVSKYNLELEKKQY